MGARKRTARRTNKFTATASLVTVISLAVVLTGCNISDKDGSTTGLNRDSKSADFARGAGSPTLATKNTVRIPGADAIADAAGAAIAVYPSNTLTTRPAAVSFVDRNDWRSAVVMGVLMSSPLRAPILLSSKDGDVPDVTASAYTALKPSGANLINRPQVIAAGAVKVPENVRTQRLAPTDPAEFAAAVDRLQAQLTKSFSNTVIVVSSEERAKSFALPAGPLAAKTGSPVLLTGRDIAPRATLRALAARKRPRIYVIGPEAAVSNQVLARLGRFGKAQRIGGATAAANAVAVATCCTYDTSTWGWSIDDPGHGMTIINAARPMDVAAATQLAVSGSYGPLLINPNGAKLDPAVEGFLLDIQPGYTDDPTAGVYNRAWLLGDETALAPAIQSRVDALCEIQLIKPAPLDGGIPGADVQ